MFYMASPDDIKNGKVTDIYFKRSETILKSLNRDVEVKAEVFLKKLPNNYSWGVLSGIEESLRLLADSKKISVRCMPEGTIFKEYEPVMVIEGKYLDFGVFETALLGFLCQSSGIATKAARCKLAAQGKPVYSFGARRVHPAITPMVERCAYIGGAEGVSTVMGAQVTGTQPVGTMPHALILIVGDTVEATRAFDEIISPQVNRIALIDTFQDEKFEAIRVCQALGNHIYALRLDTPGSRKGDFLKILEEVRWELDIRGFESVKLVVSGGLDEAEIAQLGAVADSFGVGTAISGARVLDFSMDIVEIEGKLIAKRGKMSGAKKVIRCPQCFQDKVVLEHTAAPNMNCSQCGCAYQELFVDAIKDGKLVADLPPASQIRERVIRQLNGMQWQGE
ncbi:MAG: nicotinate phosphoribosyltransferase [Actinomycetota bacterium]|nr:nicotinate phosphoribosyltransferase [Actinomycetota bacterium]